MKTPRIFREPTPTPSEDYQIERLNIFRVFSIILTVFGALAFLVSIPLVFVPEITTILAGYSPEPTACVITYFSQFQGKSNCQWSSCREGCTSEMYKCSLITVNVTTFSWAELEGMIGDRSISDENIRFQNARLLVNHFGCGYPPEVNCTTFSAKYGSVQETLPCYYSEKYPDIAIANFSIKNSWQKLTKTMFTLTTVLVLASVLYMISAYKMYEIITHKIYTAFFIIIWLGLFSYSINSNEEDPNAVHFNAPAINSNDYDFDFYDDYS